MWAFVGVGCNAVGTQICRRMCVVNARLRVRERERCAGPEYEGKVTTATAYQQRSVSRSDTVYPLLLFGLTLEVKVSITHRMKWVHQPNKKYSSERHHQTSNLAECQLQSIEDNSRYSCFSGSSAWRLALHEERKVDEN